MKTLTFTLIEVFGDEVNIVGTLSDSEVFAAPYTQTTIPNYPANNKRFARAFRVSTERIACLRNGAAHEFCIKAASFAALAVAIDPTLSYAPRFTTQPDPQGINSGDSAQMTVVVDSELTDLSYQWQYHAKAQGTLTSDGTNVADGDQVAVGGKTYTFKTTLTPTAGEVLIGADAEESLENLAAAVNNDGDNGTQYQVENQNFKVSAGAVVSGTQLPVTALTVGEEGNDIESTETSDHLSWGGVTLTNGGWQSATGVVNGTTYADDTTATLSISTASTGQTGVEHRCQVTNGAGTSTSRNVELTIN